MGEKRLGSWLGGVSSSQQQTIRIRYEKLTLSDVIQTPNIGETLKGHPQSMCNPDFYEATRPTDRRLGEVASISYLLENWKDIQLCTGKWRKHLAERGGDPTAIISPLQGYLADATSYHLAAETIASALSRSNLNPMYAVRLFANLGSKTKPSDFITHDGMTPEEAVCAFEEKKVAHTEVLKRLVAEVPSFAQTFTVLQTERAATQQKSSPSSAPEKHSAQSSRIRTVGIAGIVAASVVPIVGSPAPATAAPPSPTSVPVDSGGYGRVIGVGGIDRGAIRMDPVGAGGTKNITLDTPRSKFVPPTSNSIKPGAPSKPATETIPKLTSQSSIEEVAKAAGPAAAADFLANKGADAKHGKAPSLTQLNEPLANDLHNLLGGLKPEVTKSPANTEVITYLRAAISNPNVLAMKSKNLERFDTGDNRSNPAVFEAKRAELQQKYPAVEGIDHVKLQRLLSLAAILLAANEDPSFTMKTPAKDTSPAPAAPEQKPAAPKTTSPEVGSDTYKAQLAAAVEQAAKNENWSAEKIRFYRAAAANGIPLDQMAMLGGNVHAESSYSTDDSNSSSGARGYFQWLGNRKAAYVAFATQKGVDNPWAGSDEVATVQLAFALQELGSDQAKYDSPGLTVAPLDRQASMLEMLSRITAANSPDAADQGAQFIMHNYERPSPGEKAQSGPKRGTEARKVYDAFHKLSLDNNLYTGVRAAAPQPAPQAVATPEQPKHPEVKPQAADPASIEGITYEKKYEHPTNGKVVQLYNVGNGIVVNGDIAIKVHEMIDAAKKDGVTLTGGGWRSYERQAELRIKNGCPDANKSRASTCRVPTAIPGHGNHEIGNAIDFKLNKGVYEWLTKHAGDYGLKQLPSERWHWSPNAK